MVEDKNGNVLRSEMEELKRQQAELWRKAEKMESEIHAIDKMVYGQKEIIRSNTELMQKMVVVQNEQTQEISSLKVKIYSTGAVIAAVVIIVQVAARFI